MNNIWILLIWLTVVTVEAFLYSFFKFTLSGPYCNPTRISLGLNAFFEYLDRFSNFQSWFFPLMWLYWPTKTRKEENRKRRKAAKKLREQSSLLGIEDEEPHDDDNETYVSSLDGDSYFDMSEHPPRDSTTDGSQFFAPSQPNAANYGFLDGTSA